MRPKRPPEGLKRPDPPPPPPPKEFGWRWRYIHTNGAYCDFSKEEFAREMERAAPGSRVVELAPVDPLERAVIDAAVSVAEGLREGCSLTRGEIYRRQGGLLAAVDALIAAREGA